MQKQYILQVGAHHCLAVDRIRELVIDPGYQYTVPFIAFSPEAIKLYCTQLNVDIRTDTQCMYEVKKRAQQVAKKRRAGD